jgi:uncharacterized protein (DUF488 family)
MTGVGIVGIGYEGLTLDAMISDLVSDGVGIVYDVRLTPLSRKPGFSKTAFSRALGDVGIKYMHFRVLGNPKWNRDGFGGSEAELRAAREIFNETVLTSPGAQSAIDEIRRHSTSQKTALLCFERDQKRCHRSLVMAHILGSGDRLSAVS